MLETSIPIYIWGIASLRPTGDFTPGTSLIEHVEIESYDDVAYTMYNIVT
jgi:hypothetical protein